MNNPYAPEMTEASEQEVEAYLLRKVFERLRRVMRFMGVDKLACDRAWLELDMAVEEMKIFDGGIMDIEDLRGILQGSSSMSLAFKIVDAYESGYGHGLQTDGVSDADGALYSDPRMGQAHAIGYKKGAKVARLCGPQVAQRELATLGLQRMREEQQAAIPVSAEKTREINHILGLEEVVLQLPEEFMGMVKATAKAYGVVPQAVLRQLLLAASAGDVRVAAAEVPVIRRAPPTISGGDDAVAVS